MTSYNQCLKITSYWVLLLCLLSFNVLADDSAAVVLFQHGVVTVTTSTGSHDLVKGDKVAAGSTIHTSDNSRVQLRFTDGGLVSLMPNSIFAVDSYQQPTANDQGSVSMNLVKGGLRTLTGTIGKQNKDSYELKTKVATLGIRGTQYVATFDNDVMHVHVGDGSVVLFNEFGELLLHAGQRGLVFLGQAPQLTNEQPTIASIPADRPTDDEREAGQTPANHLSHSLPIHMIDRQAVENASDRTPQYLSAYYSAASHLSPKALSAKELAELSEIYRHISFADESLTSIAVENGTAGYVSEDLVWGSFESNQALKLPAGGNTFATPITHFFVIGKPANNFPVVGTLSYRFNGQQPQNASQVYNPTGDNTDIYQLLQFELAMYLNGNSAVATVDLKLQAPTQQIGYRTEQPEEIHWTNGKKGSFELSSTTSNINNTCPNCELTLSGVLAGQNLANAGVIYKLTDGNSSQYAGAATLDLVPALTREMLYAVYHSGGMSFGEAGLALDSAALSSSFSDVLVSVSGTDFNNIDFIANNPSISLTKNIRKTGELVWGDFDVQSDLLGDSKHFFVFASPGPMNLDALGIGTIRYKLDQATAVQSNLAGSHSLTRFNLDVELVAGPSGTLPSYDVDMALNSNGSIIQYAESGLGSSWLAPEGAFLFSADNAANCSGCELIVNGVIAGANQQQAGVTYHFRENNDHYFGAAALKKTP